MVIAALILVGIILAFLFLFFIVIRSIFRHLLKDKPSGGSGFGSFVGLGVFANLFRSRRGGD